MSLNPREILSKTIEKVNPPETIRCVLRKSSRYNRGEKRLTARVWEKPPQHSRIEIMNYEVVQEPEPPDPPARLAGLADFESRMSLMVQNESEIWIYNEQDREYQRIEIDAAITNRDLITFPSTLNTPFVEESNATYEGKEFINSRLTHCLLLEPTGDADQLYDSLSVWIDEEYYWPIKVVQKYEFDDEPIIDEYKLTELSFNDPIEDARFTFTPPQDAKEKTR
ncbi:outer membrane lipoprotein carrier protein LolA [Halobellus rarus]|uniref:Outer membrane lipoprotein carrier protein LolA n=1 Tax=Halobellus rarus TaxID=1126237 RepID=A0ABD6CTF8_9EURY